MRIVFCVPGETFTDKFMESWTNLLVYCLNSGFEVAVSAGKGASVAHVRTQLVFQGKGIATKDAAVFKGEAYDYMMWIDSDMVFKPEDFQRLLDADKDIISGVAAIDTKGMTATGFFNGFNPTQYIKGRVIDQHPVDKDGLIDLDFCGFAFVLIKQGVFESMEYPWFQPEMKEVGGHIIFPSEDFSWCMRAKELGWKIYVDPKVKIGHQKSVIIGAPERCS